MAKQQTRRSISISGETYERLAAYCQQNSRTCSDVVEAEVRRFLGLEPRSGTPRRPVRPRSANETQQNPIPSILSNNSSMITETAMERRERVLREAQARQQATGSWDPPTAANRVKKSNIASRMGRRPFVKPASFSVSFPDESYREGVVTEITEPKA